jgi:PKD repeat protein
VKPAFVVGYGYKRTVCDGSSVLALADGTQCGSTDAPGAIAYVGRSGGVTFEIPKVLGSGAGGADGGASGAAHTIVTSPFPNPPSFTWSAVGLVVTFLGTSLGCTAGVVWDFGDGTPHATGSLLAVHTYATGGTYTVTLSVECDGHGASTSGHVTVCSAAWTAVVTDLDAVFSATDRQFGEAYAWDFGDTDTGIGPVPSHLYAAPNVYVVSLTSVLGIATDTVAKSISVPSWSAVREGLTASFTGLGMSGASSIAWDFGDGEHDTGTANPEHTYTSCGTFPVKVTTVMNGVTATYTHNITMVLAEFHIVTAGLTVEAFPVAHGCAVTCEWDFGDGFTSIDCGDVSHTFATGGSKVITLTVTHDGVSDTTTQDVDLWQTRLTAIVQTHEDDVAVGYFNRIPVEGGYAYPAEIGTLADGSPALHRLTGADTYRDADEFGYTSPLDGSADVAQLSHVTNFAFDSGGGELYFFDRKFRGIAFGVPSDQPLGDCSYLRRTLDGFTGTVCGGGFASYDEWNTARLAGFPLAAFDGTGFEAKFFEPAGLCLGPDGNFYCLDLIQRGIGYGSIRRITPSGAVTTVAGKHAANEYVTSASPYEYRRGGWVLNADPMLAEIPASQIMWSGGIGLQSAWFCVDSGGNGYVLAAFYFANDHTGSAGSYRCAVMKIAGTTGSPCSGAVTLLTAGTGHGLGIVDGRGTTVYHGHGYILFNPFDNLLYTFETVQLNGGAPAYVRTIDPTTGVVTTISGSATLVGTGRGAGSASYYAAIGPITLGSGGGILVTIGGGDIVHVAADGTSTTVFTAGY